MAPPFHSSKFPRELLEQPWQARLDYFKDYMVAHPALSQADKAVWNAVREPAGALLIFVFGPTGVGKTTLLAHIENRLVEQALPLLEEDWTHLPVVKVEAVAPSVSPFRWADFYKRALTSVQEPLVDYKVNEDTAKWAFQRQVMPRSGSDTAGWRFAWEQVLRYRRPAAVLIDEAQHMAKGTRGAKLLDQLDHIKSLAVMTNTVHEP